MIKSFCWGGENIPSAFRACSDDPGLTHSVLGEFSMPLGKVQS